MDEISIKWKKKNPYLSQQESKMISKEENIKPQGL